MRLTFLNKIVLSLTTKINAGSNLYLCKELNLIFPLVTDVSQSTF